MLYKEACTAYLSWAQYEKGFSPRTLEIYRERLEIYDRFVGDQGGVESPDFPARLNTVLLRQYIHHLGSLKLRPRTISNRICPLRSLCTYLTDQQLIETNPAARLTLPRKDAATRYVVSDEEARMLLEAVELQRDRKRVALERAMMHVLVFTGVRWSEFLDLKVSDLNLSSSTLTIAHGKGEKSRVTYPTDDCLQSLRDWLSERKKMGCKHDWLWAFDIARRMGNVGTRAMLEDIKARAGLSHAHWIKPHAFRRGMATRMLRNGADILSVQAALGHSDAQTTLMYTRHREKPAELMAQTAAIIPNAFKPSPTAPVTPPPSKPTRAETISRMRRRSVSGGLK